MDANEMSIIQKIAGMVGLLAKAVVSCFIFTNKETK